MSFDDVMNIGNSSDSQRKNDYNSKNESTNNIYDYDLNSSDYKNKSRQKKEKIKAWTSRMKKIMYLNETTMNKIL